MGWFSGWRRWLVGGVVVVAVLAVGGPYVYIHFIEGKAPKKLSLSSQDPSGSGTTTTAGGSSANVPLDGTWKVGTGSQAGYRVKEVLFGQNNEAVGRTTAVTGQMTIAGTSVSATGVTVDLTKVSSDKDRRDSQFHGRIMDTSSFPTAAFKLSQPITIPTTGRVSTKANGDLTLKGMTKEASADIQAERSGATIRVSGSIPITFADWNIPNPSFGPVTTEDHGLIEFLLVLTHS
ncbi:MAG: YceI family protein [Acidimicrobiales bacterium]|nr:YceI family protein [Acidimicrobiales bacterium]